MSRQRIWPAFFLSALAVFAACDDGEGQSIDLTATFPTYLSTGDVHGALLVGTLEREGPCLYIDDGHAQTLLALPHIGATWDEKSETLTLRDLKGDFSIPVGATVAVGGASYAGGEGIIWVREPDPSCDTASVWRLGGAGPIPAFHQTRIAIATASAAASR